ncbi:aspartate dehydrogenase [Candidatus Omnitrophota bacterium]
MKKIGIIGCGTIGRAVIEFIQKKLKNKARIVALCDIDSKKVNGLSRKIKPRPIICDIESLIKKSDLIIEAAGVNVSERVARCAVLHKKDVLIMSTGGLLKKAANLFKKARAKGCNIYIPSGAICGLDGLVSASAGKIKRVTLTTRKPPRGLRGASYFKTKDIKNIKKETIIYDGNAEDAIRYFPKNINVAATLSLSGIGAKRTSVRIITAPEYKKNIHEVEVEGEFGRLFARTENTPSRENPKTSQLAIFSALSKLKEVI